MAHEARSIYEQLTGVKVDDVTIEQLDFTRNTFVDKESVEYWKGVITISKILEASRTYSWGLPVPDAGAVGSVLVEAGGSATIQPSGSELWQVTGMMGTGTLGSAVINLMWFDGAGQVVMVSQQTLTTSGTMIDINEKVSAPFILSNSLYLAIAETGGANSATINYAYHKVSL